MTDDLSRFADRRIVILDDSRNFREMLRAMLRGFGLRRIDVLSEAAALLPHLDHHRVDLALIDLVMTGTGGTRGAGLDLIRRVRRSGSVQNRAMAAVLMTGHTSRSVVAAAVGAGADHVLAKPLSPRAVLAAIGTLLAVPRPYAPGPDGYFGPDLDLARRRLLVRAREADRAGRPPVAPRPAAAPRPVQVPGFNVPLRIYDAAFLD